MLELLGRGGSSEVYRVWDEKLERQSALKLFRPEWDRSRGVPSTREARVLARLRHANVVTIYGVDTHEGQLGLWMELIHGRTLDRIPAQSSCAAGDPGSRVARSVETVTSASAARRSSSSQAAPPPAQNAGSSEG